MRIPLVDAEAETTDLRTATILKQLFEGWGLDYNVLKAIANNAQVLEGMASFIAGIFGGLPGTQRELAYLTTSIVNECFY